MKEASTAATRFSQACTLLPAWTAPYPSMQLPTVGEQYLWETGEGQKGQGMSRLMGGTGGRGQGNDYEGQGSGKGQISQL